MSRRKVGDDGLHRVGQRPTHVDDDGPCLLMTRCWLQASIRVRMPRDYVEHPICRQAKTEVLVYLYGMT